MGKTHTTLTIDNDVLQKAKALDLNLSGEFQRYLEKVVNTYEGNLEGVNLELLNAQILKLKNNKLKVDMELESKIRMQEQLMEIIRKKEEDKLKKEKEAIENAKKCIQCGRLIEGEMKYHRFNKGVVCNPCFMSASGKDFKAWDVVE